MKLIKSLLAMVGATVLLGALVCSASASSFGSSSQTLRTVFQRVHFNGAFGDITCIVTLEGSLHSRTITKINGFLLGLITAANLGACAEGSATILRETLPWHIDYGIFTGALPNITRIEINIIGYALRIREPLATCLARGEFARPVVLTLLRTTATGVLNSAEVRGNLPTSCGVEGRFDSDRPAPTVLGTTTRITVTLI